MPTTDPHIVHCRCPVVTGGATMPSTECPTHGPAVRERERAIRADERERLAAVLEYRAATAEQRRDNVMAGHLRGAARILRQAGDG